MNQFVLMGSVLTATATSSLRSFRYANDQVIIFSLKPAIYDKFMQLRLLWNIYTNKALRKKSEYV